MIHGKWINESVSDQFFSKPRSRRPTLLNQGFINTQINFIKGSYCVGGVCQKDFEGFQNDLLFYLLTKFSIYLIDAMRRVTRITWLTCPTIGEPQWTDPSWMRWSDTFSMGVYSNLLSGIQRLLRIFDYYPENLSVSLIRFCPWIPAFDHFLEGTHV